MKPTSEGTEYSSLAVATMRPGQDPLSIQPIEIRLVPSDVGIPCNFWIGLTVRGPETPTRLMDFKDVGALFGEAASRGVNEPGPLILSDTSTKPPRFVYLLPIPTSDPKEREAWTLQILSTVSAWAPPAVGFYIAPELMTTQAAQDLLRSVLTRLIDTDSGCPEEIYLLIGTYGLNALLNVVLQLKGELETETRKLFVHH